MKLDFVDLKSKLERNEDVLVDGGYLEPDIEVIFNYHAKSVENPPRIQKYFNDVGKSFDFLKFLQAYIFDMIGIEVQLSYTDDEWLQISNPSK